MHWSAQRIRARLEQLVPEWRVDFDSAELLDNAQVKLTNLSIGPRERGDVLVELPELLLQLEPQLLAENLQVLVTRAEVRQVVVHLDAIPTGSGTGKDCLPRQ